MAINNLTTDQKFDLLLSKFDKLDSKVSTLDSKVNSIAKGQIIMQKDITTIKTEVSHLIELSSDALLFGAKAKDRLDEIEANKSKPSKKSFTPFTSGAFIA